ncbi:hypothetical protein GCM10023219_29970 [Stakelama sediminis]|uniref:Uncharacterized protein n=2 Tax=Stakelama sediminis TaxID=463200 RepID=A0A840Z2X5_9SPHN|nr:hypothetical protein [Stakelama sediminis]
MTQVRGTFQMNYTLEIDTIEDADFLVLTALAMSGGLASITIDGKTFTRGHVSEITYTAHPRSVRIVMTGPPLV